MTADIVNLRRARKQKTRRDAEAAADANRLAFGRPKAERAATSLEKARFARALDAHRRDRASDRND